MRKSTSDRRPRIEEPTTDRLLLELLRDWRKDAAWESFFTAYDPLVRGWCREAGVGPGDLDEVVQALWMRLALRLKAFEYDPSKRFRGWLRLVARRHAVDHLRSRPHEIPLEEAAVADPRREPEADSGTGEVRRRLARAVEVQEVVRRKVGAKTWEVFRRCAIEGRSVAEVARDLEMTYAAAYMAVARVRRKLREEGRREPDAPGGPA